MKSSTFKRQKIKDKKENIFLVCFLIIFLGNLFRFQFGDLLLNNFGECIEADMTSNLTSTKYVRRTFLYQFDDDSKIYKGNSYIDETKKLDKNKICVVYLKAFPSVNKPVKSLSKQVECGCN